MNHEERSGMWFLVRWAAILLFVLALVGYGLEAIGYAVLPTFLSLKREALQESREYQVGIITDLQTAMNQYNDAEVERAKAAEAGNQELANASVAQQKNALKSMETAFNKLGGVNAVQNQEEFRTFVQFYNAHKAELR